MGTHFKKHFAGSVFTHTYAYIMIEIISFHFVSEKKNATVTLLKKKGKIHIT